MTKSRPTALNQTALALIRRWFDGRPRWLVLSNDNESATRLIEAERLEKESLRESIDREIAWELGLRRRKDYIVSNVPRLHLESPVFQRETCSGKTEERFNVVEFFLVELYGKQGRDELDQKTHVEWWTVDQLLNPSGATLLQERQRTLLEIADILNEERKHE
ncbi:hypothetical protein KOR42_08180 [Thalassoglobus neptunius]|uniref:Nudix hydrolase domain-containing protein n=1 Tax=Thalassoglobus neptunius TaxID=1938619 RepID=A0A5C5X307_9PLAN|nr:hypothetical protein [Thalassoglobus neptunius]TWT57457.1 hypothetical protein KOR42_08180 [Thalassoglobus neptunius]